MADPNPTIGLPNAEYIELFNRGKKMVSLAGCILILGSNEKILGKGELGSNEYLIICDAEKKSLFPPDRKILPIESMPAVRNTGQTITLRSFTGKVIFSVEFTDRWYRSDSKAGGGRSLEMIDPENFCGRAENWCESSDPSGGTPGFPNSVNAANPDEKMPKLIRATMKSNSTVLLHFSESMDSIALSDPDNYSANHGLLHPLRADPMEPGYAIVGLDFGTPLKDGLTYTVTTLNTLKDCAGNPLDHNAHASFGLPQVSDSFDVVINELLFDTPDTLSEFIELYNRSGKLTDLSDLSLALCDLSSDSVKRITSLKSNPFLLFPDHYVAITRRTDYLPNRQNQDDLSCLAEQPLLFNMPDGEGEIALLGASGNIIDRFCYSTHMHSEFLNKTEGISLERIRADKTTNDISNWCSAASTAGYATPGYKNSQFLASGPEKDNIIIEPAIFSPDEDGMDDMLVMTLEPGRPGFIANIIIFDGRGMLTKTWASQLLLSTQTTLTWDGRCNDQNPADIGIYLIYIELFNENGLIKKYRKVVTLVRRL